MMEEIALAERAATEMQMGAPGPYQWPLMPPPATLLTPPENMSHLQPMGGTMGGPTMAMPSLQQPPMGMPPYVPRFHPMAAPPPPANQPPWHPLEGEPINPDARMILPGEEVIRVGNMRMAKAGESVQFFAKNPSNKVEVYDDQSIVSVRDQAFTMGHPRESVLDVTGPPAGPKQVTCTAALAEAFFVQGGISFWKAGSDPYDCNVLELCTPSGFEYPSLERTQELAARSENQAVRRNERRGRTTRIFLDMPRNFPSLNDTRRDECMAAAEASVRQRFQGSGCRLVFSPAETTAGHTKASILTQVTAPEGKDIITILKEVDLHAIKFIPTPQEDPALTRLDSATAKALGVKNCCLSTSCNGPGCDAKRIWGKRNAPPSRETSYKKHREEKQQSQEHALSTVAAQVAEARKANNVCRKWKLGRCTAPDGHDGSTHGTPEQAKAIKCCAARKSGEPGYNRHYGIVCSFLPETCPYGEHQAPSN